METAKEEGSCGIDAIDGKDAIHRARVTPKIDGNRDWRSAAEPQPKCDF